MDQPQSGRATSAVSPTACPECQRPWAQHRSDLFSRIPRHGCGKLAPTEKDVLLLDVVRNGRVSYVRFVQSPTAADVYGYHWYVDGVPADSATVTRLQWLYADGLIVAGFGGLPAGNVAVTAWVH